jgi:hypothetical protein
MKWVKRVATDAVDGVAECQAGGRRMSGPDPLRRAAYPLCLRIQKELPTFTRRSALQVAEVEIGARNWDGWRCTPS